MNLQAEYEQQLQDGWDDLLAHTRVLRRLRLELLDGEKFCKSKEAKESHLQKIKKETNTVIAEMNRQTLLLSGYVNAYNPQRSLFDSFKGIYNPENL